jgi:hypothetical protein
MKGNESIVVDYPLNEPPAQIWRALTEPKLLAQWLMENDIQPIVGHKFNFRSKPMADWDASSTARFSKSIRRASSSTPGRGHRKRWQPRPKARHYGDLDPDSHRHRRNSAAPRPPRLPGRRLRLPGHGPGLAQHGYGREDHSHPRGRSSFCRLMIAFQNTPSILGVR